MTQDNPKLGILLMLGFCILAPLSDVFAQYVATTVPLMQIVFARFVVQLVLIRPKLWTNRHATWAQPHLFGLILLRAVLHLVSISCLFFSLRYLLLVDAIAIVYVLPFLVLLVGFFRGESITMVQIALCVLGFIGTLLVLQPSFEQVGWPALLPLAVAVLFTGFMFITRHLSHHIPTVDLQAINGICITTIVGGLLLIGLVMQHPFLMPVAINVDQFFHLLAIGAFGTMAHLLMTWALRYAPASKVAPVQYIEIPCAAIWGWVMFSDIPNYLAATGIMLTIAAGLLIWLYEQSRQNAH